MSEPQQPELARSRRSAASESSAKAKATPVMPQDTPVGAPVPEDNLPGHHPDVEQDKPTQLPTPASPQRFALRRDEPFVAASRVFGVTDETAYVELDDDQLEVRFGPWHVSTPLSNVDKAEVTGPYQWWKVIGPPRLSLRDRGLTFATSDREGVCIRFRQPVRGLEPGGVIRHPGITVSVADADEVARLINQAKNKTA